MSKGFTLVELLAVISIIAIIALIATVRTSFIVDKSEEDIRLSSSIKYIDEVNLKIANTAIKGERIPDGKYSILDGGKKISNGINEYEIKLTGDGLTEGILYVQNQEVISIIDGKSLDWYIYMDSDKNIKISDKRIVGGLYDGNTFNSLIKGLANSNNTSIKTDHNIISIRFMINGEYPEEYTSETINDLPHVIVSPNSDIMGYYSMGTIYVISNDSQMIADKNSSYMFSNLASLSNIDLSYLNTVSVEKMNGMFENDISLTSLDLTNFDTTSVEDFSSMFKNCSTLESIVTSYTFKLESTANQTGMFTNCLTDSLN